MDGHCDKGSENYANIGMRGLGERVRCWIDARMNGSLVFDAWLHEFREFVSPSSILESGHGEGWDWDQRVSLMRFELF